jgi:hypothetical protein
VQIDFGATQLLADYIDHWENGWFPAHSFGGSGPFILIQIPKLCGVRLEKVSMFILVIYLVAARGLRNFICRQINTRQHFRPIPFLLNAKRLRTDQSNLIELKEPSPGY